MIKLLVFAVILITCLIDIIIVVSTLRMVSKAEEQVEQLMSLEEYSDKMMNEGMDPEEYVDIYNKYIEEENSDGCGFLPHEHI